MANSYIKRYEEVRARDGWLSAVSVSDWVMALPHDSDYISPFHMQGCLYA